MAVASRMAAAIRSNTLVQSPAFVWWNSRIVGYQGLSSRSSIQRQQAAYLRAEWDKGSQIELPFPPSFYWAGGVSRRFSPSFTTTRAVRRDAGLPRLSASPRTKYMVPQVYTPSKFGTAAAASGASAAMSHAGL